MKKQESKEDYLETILLLSKKSESVRSIDIANEMEFSKPSVSVAMKNLRINGYITTNADGFISLTDDGRKIAESVFDRHTVLMQTLIKIGVSEATAKEDACKLEHDISTETFLMIKKFLYKDEKNNE